MWRWAVGVWVAIVVIGGGLTLWLQDANEPPPPVGWEEAEASPVPGPPDGWETLCPVPEPAPRGEDGATAYACLYRAP
uniref:hypothetical protein n=1 Tax=Streptomyces sp. TaxID=1931 RepID=UPI002811B6F5|nr:hypothetical protein [Streptomyces sp.]